MPFHDQLPFDSLHKAKFDTGLDASRPVSPEGTGDIYWAPDANSGAGALYLTNAAGDAWVEFSTAGGSTLNDISDVDAVSPNNGDVIKYNTGTGNWESSAVAQSLNDLTDVDLSGLSDGDVIVYDNGGGNWVVASKVSNIVDLDGVATFTQSKGDMIVSNGTDFSNLAVGIDGYHIIADSGQTLGVRWELPFTSDQILTDGSSVLIDSSGNVMTV